MKQHFIPGETYTRTAHGWRRQLDDGGSEITYDLEVAADQTTRHPVEHMPDLDGPREHHENVTDRLDRYERVLQDRIEHDRAIYKRLEAVDDQMNRFAIELGTKAPNDRVTAVDGMRVHDRDALSQRIDDVNKRVDNIVKEIELKGAIERLTREKPKLKAGWLNIYGDGEPLWHSTREGADNGKSQYRTRIACVEVPDVTEGEGL